MIKNFKTFEEWDYSNRDAKFEGGLEEEIKSLSYILEDEGLVFFLKESENSVVDYYLYITPIGRRYILNKEKQEISKSDYIFEFVERAREIFDSFGMVLGKASLDQPNKILFEIQNKNKKITIKDAFGN
jgi:hypothetical protein